MWPLFVTNLCRFHFRSDELDDTVPTWFKEIGAAEQPVCCCGHLIGRLLCIKSHQLVVAQAAEKDTLFGKANSQLALDETCPQDVKFDADEARRRGSYCDVM